MNLFIKIALFAFLFLPHTLLMGQEYPTFTAKKGDGAYSVLKQNGYTNPGDFNRFVELNKTKLGKDNTLILGETYRLPLKTKAQEKEKVAESTIDERLVFEIFGPKYREIKVKSRELAGAVFYLQSGHGGPDPGAIGSLNGHDLCEDEYAYDVTLRLARNLIEYGATVYLIIRDPNDGIRDEQYLLPDKDEVCYPNDEIPLSQLARLKQSTNAVNALHALNKKKFERLVVIHIDSRDEGKNIDVFFYHNPKSVAGKLLATKLMQTFDKKYAIHQPNRGYTGSVSERNLYVLKNSAMPAVFIELGNINHVRDQQRLIVADNRQAMANWLRDGLIEDFRSNSKRKAVK